MFKALIGDLFESRAQTLVNTVNCVGVMGKGVAEQFKRRYPAMFEDYKSRTDREAVRLGSRIFIGICRACRSSTFQPRAIGARPHGSPTSSAGSTTWRPMLRSGASPAWHRRRSGAATAAWSGRKSALSFTASCIACPSISRFTRLWNAQAAIDEEFLSTPQISLNDKGQKQQPLKPEWVVLMEVLRELQAQPYANPVGRTIFQKIGYVVTEMGVPTGFQFGKGSYGPFSGEVKPRCTTSPTEIG